MTISATDIPPERLEGVKVKIFTSKDEFIDFIGPIWKEDVDEECELVRKNGETVVACFCKDPFYCGAEIGKKLSSVSLGVVDTTTYEDPYKLVVGVVLTAWTFDKYKSNRMEKKILFYNPNKDKLKKPIEHAKAQMFARELATEPPNIINPKTFVDRIFESIKELPIEAEVLEKDDLEREGLNLLLSVGKGSDIPPRLLILRYNNGKQKIGLIGKGVTFDAGGYCIKPAEYMRGMHADMSGAAVVASATLWAAKLNIPISINTYIPLAENLISGRAYKVEDIVRSYSGKSVHIGNTDAEGRLILADALAYSKKDMNNLTVTLATLTGAQIVALGYDIAALYATKDEDANLFEEASRYTNEIVWRMPLYERYRKYLKHPSADINNISKIRQAGSIMGALFLKEFAPERWVYLDIAGPALAFEGNVDWASEYPTGWGTRLLLEVMERMG